MFGESCFVIKMTLAESEGVYLMNDKELFENNCFPLFWCEDEEHFAPAEVQPQRKDLTTLLAELEDIQNRIDDINAREWHLAKLVKFHKEGLLP